jgi:hypothetical protein
MPGLTRRAFRVRIAAGGHSGLTSGVLRITSHIMPATGPAEHPLRERAMTNGSGRGHGKEKPPKEQPKGGGPKADTSGRKQA